MGQCKVCGSETKRKRYTYCSNACQQEFQGNEIDKKIEAGNLKGIGNARIRKFLIKKYGPKCTGGPTEDTKDCRWSKINPHTGQVPIEMEHIDGNSNNNKLDNLKLLCPCCHSLTATYKALNKGNGRHKRKLRYQEGKSY